MTPDKYRMTPDKYRLKLKMFSDIRKVSGVNQILPIQSVETESHLSFH